jgi:hypothetical protein
MKIHKKYYGKNFKKLMVAVLSLILLLQPFSILSEETPSAPSTGNTAGYTAGTAAATVSETPTTPSAETVTVPPSGESTGSGAYLDVAWVEKGEFSKYFFPGKLTAIILRR